MNTFAIQQDLKSYQKIDENTGEITDTVKYLIGNPRQYRFNGQTGRFNLNGLTDLGNQFTLIPMAWRIFKATLFGRKRVELWAEIFFLDKDNCVGSIMFNNTSAQILQKTFGQIIYKDLTLDQVQLKISSDKRLNEKAASSYYVAQFEFEPAPEEALKFSVDFARDYPIYRADTISEEEKIILSSLTYKPATEEEIHSVLKAA